jgi:hypothetical protein
LLCSIRCDTVRHRGPEGYPATGTNMTASTQRVPQDGRGRVKKWVEWPITWLPPNREIFRHSVNLPRGVLVG